jgi:uncharacterized tellurite resistance protein B-like protein
MELNTPSPEVARVGLRAMKSIALADGELHELERGMIDGAQRHVLKTCFDIDALESISAAELGEVGL